jgi:hypothetical protein
VLLCDSLCVSRAVCHAAQVKEVYPSSAGSLITLSLGSLFLPPEATSSASAAAAAAVSAVVVVLVVVVVALLVGEGAGDAEVRSTTGAGLAAAATAAAAAAAAVIGATVQEGPLTNGWPRADLREDTV